MAERTGILSGDKGTEKGDSKASRLLVDEVVVITELIEAPVLSGLVESMTRFYGLRVFLYDADGRNLCSNVLPEEQGPRGEHYNLALEYAGDRVGEVVVIGERDKAEKVCLHLKMLLETLLHAAFRCSLSQKLAAQDLHDCHQELAEKSRSLISANSRLEELEGLKSNFIATVSHELRTPLTSIIGYSDMLAAGMAGELNTEQHEFVKTILSKSDQLLNMITGILDASLLEQKSLQLKREVVSLSEIITSVAENMSHDLSASSLSLSLPNSSLPSSSVPNAVGDSAKLKQVVLHLLANAIKFSPAGGEISISIRVGALAQSDKSSMHSPFWQGRRAERFGLLVTVQDQGVGIPLEKRNYIFEPFFQVDSGASRTYGGPGLGLSLAHSYVSAHGGSLWVEDGDAGRGSKFTFSVPAQAEELESYVESPALEGS